MQHEAEGRCQQHHADGDENRRNANHVARYALRSELYSPGKTRKFQARSALLSPSGATLASMLIRRASVLLANPELVVPCRSRVPDAAQRVTLRRRAGTHVAGSERREIGPGS